MELDMVPNLLTPTQQLYSARIDFRSLSLSSSYFGGGVRYVLGNWERLGGCLSYPRVLYSQHTKHGLLEIPN